MSIASETKVGLLVITAAVGLGWLSMQSGVIGSSSTNGEYRILKSNFGDVDGLAIGSKIKVAGVQVGEISDIVLNGNGTATLVLAVKKDVPLPENVKAKVATSGLIGEKFVALTTDFTPKGELSIEAEQIPSMGTEDFGNLAANFSKISDDLQQVSASLRSALGGQENSDKLSRIVNNLDSLGGRLNDIFTKEIKQDQLGNIVANLENFSSKLDDQSGDMIADMRDSASALKRILADNENNAGDLIANLGVASRNLSVITDRMVKGEGMLGQMMTKDSTAIADFELAMADLRSVANKIDNGEGTLGRLINDPSTAEKIDGALDSFADLTNRMENFRTDVDFYGYSLMAEDVAKGRFDVTFRPRPSRYYTIGVMGDGFSTESDDPNTSTSLFGQDFGDDLKITAQFGHVFEAVPGINKDLGFRVGIKDSTFGLGTDMNFWDEKVKVSTDLYDMSGEHNGNGEDNPHLDLTARINLLDRTIYAVGGYDNVLSEKYGSPFVGIGFHFQDDDLKYMLGQAL